MRAWRDWFRLAWRSNNSRRVVISDIATIGAHHPHFLADLALRGNVFDDSNPPTDPVALGIYLGRRQLALETIKLCRRRPEQLFDYLSAPEEK